MLWSLLQLASGLALLVLGGRGLVTGAAALARDLGVPAIVVGLTVVAFGTSTPELAVNAISAIRGTGDLAFGNVMGSNLANVGLILGLAALVRPLTIQSIVITREIPMMLLASIATLVLALDRLRGETPPRFDRPDALILLLFFAVFLYYTAAETLRGRRSDALVEQVARGRLPALRSVGASAAMILAGLVALTLGGQITVSGAVELARMLAIPNTIIGLTVVAVGTSLPELATSLVAARRGETDLAVGNVVGSNVFNLLFVLATTAWIRPVPVPEAGLVDLGANCALAALLWIVASTYGGRRLTHVEGWLLLAAYLGYVIARSV
jgi:cation:H+ antiporter